jgi:hypothetical protein
MQYVLGNMLNGGGINPDGLSLDLQFAADKTLTARRGPTPVFTRSSGDNGGTTYFGPLVDFELVDSGEVTAFSTTGISNGRASWFKSYEGIDITISYTGTRWRVIIVFDGIEDEYLAAPGSEWRPDQADWSSQEFTITTSSTFGIVKAANNEPRFDHDPVTLACKGLLIEEGRTNLATYSDDFASAFTVERASVLYNNATSPDGATTADKLVEDTTVNSSHRLVRPFNLSAIPHTFSVFAKASERSWIRMTLFDGTTGRQVWFDVSAGTIGTESGATGQITSFGNGWWRCSITATGLAFAFSQANIALATADNILAYTGDGTSGLFLWGAQLEAGSFATSYIPTTTGTLARSADLCSITGANFTGFYNQSEGTMSVSSSCFAPSTGVTRRVLSISDGTINNRNSILNAITGTVTAGLTQVFLASSGGITQAIIGIQGLAITSLNKTAAVYKVDDFAISTNGSAVNKDTSGLVAVGVNILEIGNLLSADFLCGHIAAIRYYKKRLPDAKLQALTV